MSLVVWANSGGWEGPQPIQLLMVFGCALVVLWLVCGENDDGDE